jgi:lipopolysaccharide assembly outer membrane protein LptD (OstA)
MRSVKCVTVLLAVLQFVMAGGAGAEPEDLLSVQADTALYETNGRVTFRGDVELYFGLFILAANEVVYNEKTQTLIASGNVSVRYEDGSTSRADIWVLPEEIRDAFVRSLRRAESRTSPFIDPPPPP